MHTLDKIQSLLKEQHKTQKNLTDFLGLKKTTFTSWKSGKNTSYTKHIGEIAEFFNVSTDYLLGKSEQKEKTAATDDLSAIKQKILNNCTNLSEKELDDVLDYIEYKISQHNR